MKRALLAVIALEVLLLAGGALAYWFGALDRFRPAPPPQPPVFRPQIVDTRIGDSVRYEKRDRATGRVLGYLDYGVREVYATQGTTIGIVISLHIRETFRRIDERGQEVEEVRERMMRIQPRALMHGFLPPRFEDEDDYPAGERPVVSRISTATFPLKEYPATMKPPPAPVHGFLVEAVVPRRSLTGIAEKYWMTDKVPVFGIARWERGDEVLVLHTMEHPERKG